MSIGTKNEKEQQIERRLLTPINLNFSNTPLQQVLTDLGERTSLTVTLLYDSKGARDGAVASGMEHGMAAGYDRLDEILEAASV